MKCSVSRPNRGWSAGARGNEARESVFAKRVVEGAAAPPRTGAGRAGNRLPLPSNMVTAGKSAFMGGAHVRCVLVLAAIPRKEVYRDAQRRSPVPRICRLGGLVY
jgi:hypothetical protein